MSIAFEVLGRPGEDNALMVTIDSGQSLHRLLFDCGEGCLDGVDRGSIQTIDGLFFSHFHVDHIAGFDRFFRCNWYRTSGPVRIFGPQDTRRVIRNRIQAYTWNLVETASGEVLVSELNDETINVCSYLAKEGFSVEHHREELVFDRTVFQQSEYRVDALQLNHGLPCMAYAVREPDRFNVDMEALATLGLRPGPWLKQVKDTSSPANAKVELPGGEQSVGELRDRLLVRQPGDSIAYLTDFRIESEAEQDRLVEFLDGCKVVVCENNFWDADERLAKQSYHMTSSEIGRLAARVHPEQLVVFHISDRYTEAEWQAQLAEVRSQFERSEFPDHWFNTT